MQNEESSIRATLESVLQQDYEGSLEVIVADGGSQDGTAAIISELAASDPKVRLIDNPGGTAPSGMNRGIEATGAEVIVRCDGRSVLSRSYITTAVAAMADTGADNVGGIQRAVGTTPFEEAVAVAMSHPVGVGDAKFRIGGKAGFVDTVYLGVFRRATLDAIGGFDKSMVRNQDYELNHRIREAGGSVYFDPRLDVAYTPRPTFGALWSQYFDYGRGKRRMLGKHPGSVRARQLAAPLLVAGLLVSTALALTPLRFLGLVVPALYAVVVLATAIGLSIGRRTAGLMRLVGILPTMHIGWGSGFLFGRSLSKQ